MIKKHNLILNVLFLISIFFIAVILVKDIDVLLSNKFEKLEDTNENKKIFFNYNTTNISFVSHLFKDYV